jgi:hypothetical protein
MSKVTKLMGVTRHTSMILLYLEAVRRPARTSEIREAVVKYSPEAAVPIYGCLGDLLTASRIRRLSRERDVLVRSTSRALSGRRRPCPRQRMLPLSPIGTGETVLLQQPMSLPTCEFNDLSRAAMVVEGGFPDGVRFAQMPMVSRNLSRRGGMDRGQGGHGVLAIWRGRQRRGASTQLILILPLTRESHDREREKIFPPSCRQRR